MTDVISFILNAVILNGVEAHGVEAHGMRARHLGKHTVHQPGPGKTTNTFTMGSHGEHHHMIPSSKPLDTSHSPLLPPNAAKQPTKQRGPP
jgi:hypothetical protein